MRHFLGKPQMTALIFKVEYEIGVLSNVSLSKCV
jgi:hypothetical protein